MKAVGLLLGLISEQASAYFINVMKGNYVLKLNLSGVLIYLATHASFQESTCEIKHKLNIILPAFAAALALFINRVKSRAPD